MSENNCLKEEYKFLRDEYNRNTTIASQISVVVVTVTATLLGFGFKTGNPYIFLTPLAVIIPTSFILANNFVWMVRTAMYIKVFIEPELGLSWETCLYMARSNGEIGGERKFMMALSACYFLLVVVCLIPAYYYLNGKTTFFWHFAGFVLLLISVGLYHLFKANSFKKYQYYEDYWKQLKSKIQ